MTKQETWYFFCNVYNTLLNNGVNLNKVNAYLEKKEFRFYGRPLDYDDFHFLSVYDINYCLKLMNVSGQRIMCKKGKKFPIFNPDIDFKRSNLDLLESSKRIIPINNINVECDAVIIDGIIIGYIINDDEHRKVFSLDKKDGYYFDVYDENGKPVQFSVYNDSLNIYTFDLHVFRHGGNWNVVIPSRHRNNFHPLWICGENCFDVKYYFPRKGEENWNARIYSHFRAMIEIGLNRVSDEVYRDIMIKYLNEFNEKYKSKKITTWICYHEAFEFGYNIDEPNDVKYCDSRYMWVFWDYE